jgi:hypothetical protein
MFKKREDEKKIETAPPRDEHAYEDSWYRSLKALREQEPDGEATSTDADEGTSGDEDEPAAQDDEGPAPGAVDVEVPESSATDVEARAGELLERLRSLQHLGDQQDDGSDPDARSALGD